MSRRLLFVLVVAALAGACRDEESVSPVAPELSMLGDERGHRPVTPTFEVYTQNVYLGGDTGPLFTIDLSDIPAVVAATNTFWAQVEQSAPAERMSAIVDEIDRRRPHVVGLQEVLRFVVLDGTMTPIGGLDLLTLIEAEIAARGLPYVTEVVQVTTSAALPLAIGATGITRLLSFNDRLVILRRSDVVSVAEDGGQYAATVPLGPITLRRGWARVDVDHHGTPHHFVTTHLEVQALAPVQAAQRTELLGRLTGLDGVTILAGDLNSDAAAEPGDASWTDTYDVVSAAGFDDLWQLSRRGAKRGGFTCCQDPSLRNVRSELDQRIDFVMVRGDATADEDGDAHGRFRAEVIGDQRRDGTPSGLWPADHAGVYGALKLVWRGQPTR
jgi:endonuclease/exonuclease/phosphatase family metal-dependent hydrolase